MSCNAKFIITWFVASFCAPNITQYIDGYIMNCFFLINAGFGFMEGCCLCWQLYAVCLSVFLLYTYSSLFTICLSLDQGSCWMCKYIYCNVWCDWLRLFFTAVIFCRSGCEFDEGQEHDQANHPPSGEGIINIYYAYVVIIQKHTHL